MVAVLLGAVTVPARPSEAQSLKDMKAQAQALLTRINQITSKVDALGQKYDLAQMKLNKINNEIANTRAEVARIESRVAAGNKQLRQAAVFAYVTNGVAKATNPLFTTNASSVGATNVYNALAQGNVQSTIAGLKNAKITLTQERAVLNQEERSAAAQTATAHAAYASAQGLQNSLNAALRSVKGQIARYVAELQAAQAAKDAKTLGSASKVNGFPAPPPNSRANIAIRAALSFIGTWYVWGGASRRGVDCSGLTMLAWDAAGVYMSHYSGAQFNETIRVPLYAIRPGDLLFYGWHGDAHVSMYLGHGKMIEASHTGTRVSIDPVRLGYDFAGVGRPR